MADSEAARALAEAAKGLTYQSETDAPWSVFTWPEAKGSPTPELVRQYGRQKTNAPTITQSVDDFFGPLTEVKDWFGDAERADAAKYRALLDTVKKYVQEPIVVKVGKRKLTIYVVGRDPAGGWAGLKTTSVET
jgi:hypothetical protein